MTKVNRASPQLSFTWIDAVVAIMAVSAFTYVAWRANSVLNYRWNWAPVWTFIAWWDPARGQWVANLILQGLWTTIRVSIWSAVLAAILGLAMGLARVSSQLFPRLVAQSYVELIRNIPPLVFIFVFYYFLTSQLVPMLGVESWIRAASPTTRSVIDFAIGPPEFLPALVSAILCLGFFEGAFVAEIVRAGINSVPAGQRQAAASLGLGPLRSMRLVVLPQALGNVLPPLAGQFISLVKDTSIISLISIQDLTFLGNEVAGTTGRVFETWIVVAALYFVLCFALSVGFSRLERSARRHRAL